MLERTIQPLKIVSNFDVLEESEDMAKSSKLSPIYLIISSDDASNKIQQKIAKALLFKTLKDFSHMGVAFDDDLKNIYTFESVAKNRANKMIIESIDDYKSDRNIKIGGECPIDIISRTSYFDWISF